MGTDNKGYVVENGLPQAVAVAKKYGDGQKDVNKTRVGTTILESTPRSMAHTEQGPPVPARPPSIHPANFRLRIFHKMFRNVPSLNVSTKVSNVPHTSFFVSLLMLSTGFTSMHSPRYDITVTHKD